VLATLVGSELPIPFGILPVSQDEHALCLDKVRFVGDPVAAVAAIDEETAEAALALIDVDYEVLPSVMSIDEALAREDVRIHDYGPHGNVHKEVSFDFGQVEDGFAEATTSARTRSSSKATPTSRWSSTPPSRRRGRTAS
jgi:CO/xanthine dehydrogenase Mo-binding subunit